MHYAPFLVLAGLHGSFGGVCQIQLEGVAPGLDVSGEMLYGKFGIMAVVPVARFPTHRSQPIAT